MIHTMKVLKPYYGPPKLILGNMTEQIKREINDMSYETMMYHQRFDPPGSVLHMGDIGQYFAMVMQVKAEHTTNEERVAVSKKIGWDK